MERRDGPVYLDCAATTPLDPRVRETLLRHLEADFANAGSRTHDYGRRARAAVEQARQQVAAVVNASRGEVIFTSGATESNNLSILGLEQQAAYHLPPDHGRGARGGAANSTWGPSFDRKGVPFLRREVVKAPPSPVS